MMGLGSGTGGEGGGNETNAPRIVALAADLIFASRIQAAARAAGVSVRMARTADAALEAARADSVRLVLLDLETRGVDVVDLVARIKAEGMAARVVVFGPHVRGEDLRRARSAGADVVLARSALVQQLARLVAEAGGEDG